MITSTMCTDNSFTVIHRRSDRNVRLLDYNCG
jgi:hypothetical protein